MLVVLPTYNNSNTLNAVLEDVGRYTDDILVVNDGSTDNTQQILDSHQIRKINYSPNRGKGYAIRQAIKYAAENGFDHILTIDSDGQHKAHDIEKFIVELDNNPCALIIGARNLRADNMPSKNTFANKFSNFWFLVETGIRLDDTQSGFRLYPVSQMAKMRFITNRYEFEVESIVRAAWKGIKVYNIPISVHYPPSEERISHFKPVKDFTRISILNSCLVIIALFYYYPAMFFRSFTKTNIKNFIRNNIIHSQESNHRVAAALGLGIFFGIAPLWGYQMITAAITAHFLRLNKVLTLVSSNISIPPMIPFILYGSFVTGGLILGKETQLNMELLSLEGVYDNLKQYLFGAIVFATACALTVYLLSIILLKLFRHKNNG